MKPLNKWTLLGMGVVVGALCMVGIRQVSAAPAAPGDATPEPAPNPAPKTVQPFQLTINSNTQAEVDDLRIAAFNFRDENGPSCALQISVRDDSSKDKKIRVHKGETFQASNKSFEVAEVGDKVVKLNVK